MLAHPVSSASGSGPEALRAQAISPLAVQVDHEVDGLGDDRPHVLGEPPIAGDQHVVPDAGRDVGTEVAVAVGVLDDAVSQLDRPRAVGPLGGPAPIKGGACGFQQTRRGERHRVLHMVPRIGVPAVEPRDGARGLLCRGDRLRCLPALRGRQHPRHARHVRKQQQTPPASGSTAPRSFRSAGSTATPPSASAMAG